MPKPLPQFLEYFLSDCLQGDSSYSAKSMFGGYGVYKDGRIFAIYAWDVIYMKVGDQNKQDYLHAGAKQFVYNKKGTDCYLSYFSLPENIIEDREELNTWIDKALDY